MSRISTKVRTPDGKKIIQSFRGRLSEDSAVKLAREYLEAQRDALQELLDSDKDFVVEVSATSPSGEVSVNGNGDVTFPADEVAGDTD